MKEKVEDTHIYFPFSATFKRLGGRDDGSLVSSLLRSLMRWIESEQGDLYALNDERHVPRATERILKLLHAKGLIKHPRMNLVPQFVDVPTIYSLRLAPTDFVKGGGSWHAAGSSFFEPEDAVPRALGEFLERYALGYAQQAGEAASVRDLEKRRACFLDPEKLGRFLPEQMADFPHYAYRKDGSVRWVKGRVWGSRKTILLPAQLVFWDHKNAGGQEAFFVQESNTSGCAAHTEFSQALSSALLEIIERDSFLAYWLNTVAPPKLDLRSITDPAVLNIIQEFERCRFDVEILYTTSDIKIPAFVVVLIDRAHNRNGVYMGGGCNLSAQSTLLNALAEALLVFNFHRRLEYKEFALPTPYRPFRDEVGPNDRLLFWGSAGMSSRIEWFLSGKPISYTDIDKNSKNFEADVKLSHIVESMRSAGVGDIYYYEADNMVLKKTGYRAVHAIAPDMIPLYLNETHAPLGCKRLWSVPKKMGFTGVNFPNPQPHPFP